MTRDEFSRLAMGDVVRHAVTGGVGVVTFAHGGRTTIVRTWDAANAFEWEPVHRKPGAPTPLEFARDPSPLTVGQSLAALALAFGAGVLAVCAVWLGLSLA